MINEPKYIVYSLRKFHNSFRQLNIIRWSDRSLYRTIILRPIKRLTGNVIVEGLKPVFSSAHTLCWGGILNHRNTELYLKSTTENIKRKLEILEGCKLDYLYLVY